MFPYLALALIAVTAGIDPPVAGPAPWRVDLLELAFDAATAIPASPHAKDRARAQEAVAAAWLELDEPGRALGCLEATEGWRRGAGYADVALYFARQGRIAEAERTLELAAHVADGVEDWRRDNVRVRIARVRARLGQDREAAALEAGVCDAETGKLAGVRTTAIDPAAFDAGVREVDRLLATGSFDVRRNALDSCTDLYDRFYGDAAERSLLEARIKSAWGDLPIFVQLDLLMKLARSALGHSDRATALALVNEAQALFEGAAWPLEYRIPLAGQLAGLRYRAGDPERALADATAALALFDASGRDEIVDIFRARTLHPLAEAFQAMDQGVAALAVYRRAVEEGAVNPNSRPRAEDLAATCRSMAVHGTEPDADLWARIRGIREGLGPPW
jgi:hypothetical protein